MTRLTKKRKVNGTQQNEDESTGQKAFQGSPSDAATSEDKRVWQGFCEIESDPAFFNVMLKDWGVKGVKVQEVFGLDEALLMMLPKPVYGLIFLFRYHTDESNNQEPSCPENVWFANQTADFSCATVSLLNIVNNIPDVELGPQIQSFKDFTKDFPPSLRGESIANFEFVKQIHNSFARKMDMLNIDLALRNSYDDRRKPKKSQETNKKTQKSNKSKKKSEKTSKAITDEDWSDDDSAFHFSAYVPIDGKVWKLDGLDRQPEKIGAIQYDDWLSTIVPILEDRMSAYAQDNIEFVLLSLVKDPLISQKSDLAQNIKTLQQLHARLDVVKPDWKDDPKGEAITKSDKILDVTADMIENAHILENVAEKISVESSDELLTLRRRLIEEQTGICKMIMEEQDSARDDERRARERRNDYGAAIQTWLKMLAQKEGVVRELIEETR